MTETLEIRHVEPGDIVETSGRRVGDAGRTGEIVEVLGGEHPHYLVRWQDGHETIFYPKEGTAIRPHDSESEVGWAD